MDHQQYNEVKGRIRWKKKLLFCERISDKTGKKLLFYERISDKKENDGTRQLRLRINQ